MKLYLFDQDNQAKGIWRKYCQNHGVAMQEFHSLHESLPRSAGNPETAIAVVDRSVLIGEPLEEIKRLRHSKPHFILIVTGSPGSIDEVVDLMRSGVAMVYPKPLDAARLDSTFSLVVEQLRQELHNEQELNYLKLLFGKLTERERQVLNLVLDGVHNRLTAEKLGISVRTVEARRAKVYRKLECTTLAELVRKVERLQQLQKNLCPPTVAKAVLGSFGKHHLDQTIRNPSEVN